MKTIVHIIFFLLDSVDALWVYHYSCNHCLFFCILFCLNSFKYHVYFLHVDDPHLMLSEIQVVMMLAR
jgi:hypothetical protein